MKWIEHLEAIAQGENLGNCPFCDSTNVDCGFVIDDEVNRMGHGAIWCNDCLNGYHFSRIRVSDNMKMQDVPLNIKHKH